MLRTLWAAVRQRSVVDQAGARPAETRNVINEPLKAGHRRDGDLDHVAVVAGRPQTFEDLLPLAQQLVQLFVPAARVP